MIRLRRRAFAFPESARSSGTLCSRRGLQPDRLAVAEPAEMKAHPTSLPCPTLSFGEHFSAADVLYGTAFARAQALDDGA